LVGLGVEQIRVAEQVTLEQFKDDQLDLDLHPEIARSLQEILAEHDRRHGITLIEPFFAQQRTESGSQLVEGVTITTQHAADHRLHRHVALQFVIGQRCRCVDDKYLRQSGLSDLVLNKADKCLVKLLEKYAFDAFALEAQITHGLEKNVLFDVVASPVRHLEERVVGIIEQCL